MGAAGPGQAVKAELDLIRARLMSIENDIDSLEPLLPDRWSQQMGGSLASPISSRKRTKSDGSRVHGRPFVASSLLLVIVIAFLQGFQGVLGEQRGLLQQYKNTKGKHVMFVSLAVPSHIRPLNHMASELMDRGYRVSFAIPEEGRKMVNAGIEVVSSGPSAVPPKELKQRFRVMSQEITSFRGILASFNEVLLPSVVPMFKSLRPTIEANPPDIMVIDICALAGLMLAQEYNLPYLLNNPSLLFSPGESSALIPAWGSGYGMSMSLTERCINAMFPRLLAMALIPPFMHLNKIRWELNLELYRSQHELLSNSVILTDTVFGIEYPRALPPLIKMVGPLLPAKLPQLPGAVTEWIRSSEPKVVLIHLGSMTYLEPWQVKEMLDGFSSDAFRVLWVMNKSQRQAVPYVPNSFLIEANVPYLAIVSHPAVIAVVSHCQLDAVQEALYFGKPILCLPFYIDQPDVASRVVDIGAGLSLDKASLSSCVLSHKIWTLISNASFSQRASAISKLLARAGGTSRASSLVQEVLTLGTDHWVLPDSGEPWHRRVLLDVHAVYLAVLMLLFLILRAIFRSVLKCWKKLSSHIRWSTPANVGQPACPAPHIPRERVASKFQMFQGSGWSYITRSATLAADLAVFVLQRPDATSERGEKAPSERASGGGSNASSVKVSQPPGGQQAPQELRKGNGKSGANHAAIETQLQGMAAAQVERKDALDECTGSISAVPLQNVGNGAPPPAVAAAAAVSPAAAVAAATAAVTAGSEAGPTNGTTPSTPAVARVD